MTKMAVKTHLRRLETSKEAKVMVQMEEATKVVVMNKTGK
jgi:hypothetical protein